jgi:hypothetical protein
VVKPPDALSIEAAAHKTNTYVREDTNNQNVDGEETADVEAVG